MLLLCIQVAAAPTLKDRIPGYGVGGDREGQGGGVVVGGEVGSSRKSVKGSYPRLQRPTSLTQTRASTPSPTQ